ncbi:MAG: hypothetical protein IPK87_11130 [Planctomycetes bacterium]|nr:hypothetical protein [Planctomycetota bacterium]
MRKLLLLCCLLLSACGPSSEEVVAEYRGRAEPRMARMAEIAATAAVHKDEFKAPAPAEKLRFAGDSGNAGLVMVEELDTNPETRPGLDFHVDTFWLDYSRDCLAGNAGDAPEGVRLAFDKLLALKYVVIVRERLYAAPVASDEKSFIPGTWEADVLVYEIEKAELLGGWSVSATNSDTVDVNTDDPGKWLHSDLWSRARKEVGKVLATVSEDAEGLLG